jgi:hypothetical protein
LKLPLVGASVLSRSSRDQPIVSGRAELVEPKRSAKSM